MTTWQRLLKMPAVFYKYLLLILLSLNFLCIEAKKKAIIKDGEQLLYRQNGTLREKSSYKNCLLHGTQYKYFEDGKTIKQATNYINGRKSGIEKYYNKLGILRDFKER